MRPLVQLAAAVAVLAVSPAVAAANELLGICGPELCRAAPEGERQPFTTDGSSDAYSVPSASSDGQRIYYVRDSGLFRAGQRNSAPERVVEAAGGRDSSSSRSGASFSLRTLEDPAGAARSTVHVGGAAGTRVWTSATEVLHSGWLGEQLILSRRAESGRTVGCTVELGPDGDPPPCVRMVANDPARSVARVVGSPDGKYVAAEAIAFDNDPATVDAQTIVLYNAKTGKPVRELTDGPADFYPAFSPDGRSVIFSRGPDTWSVPTAGGEPRRLVTGMIDAVWTGTAKTSATQPARRGRPTLAPDRRLLVRGGRVVVTARCAKGAPCLRTTWTFKQGERTRLRVRVPALAEGKRRALRVRLPRATQRRVKDRALRLRVSGQGMRARTVTLSVVLPSTLADR